MNRFEQDDAVIAYDRGGAGPAMLFIHNGGALSTIWRHQVADLGANHDTVCVDLPGFGRSPRSARGVNLHQQVDLLTSLIDHLELAPVLLIGNCMGSNVAAGIAASRPDDVAGLVLINPLTEATFSAGGLGALHAMNRYVPGPTRTMRRVARRVVPPTLAARATVRFQVGRKGIARGVHRDPALVAGNRRRDQLPALVDVLDDMAAYGALDLGPRTGGPPACTIWGAQNRVLSPEAGRALNEQLRPERAEVLAGCGHFPMLEDPVAVTEIIREFALVHLPGTATARAAATGGAR